MPADDAPEQGSGAPEPSRQRPAAGDAGSNRMLERVCLVLDALEHDRANASELARRTGLSVSTVHRLAHSMTAYGFLYRSGDGRFGLGHRFVASVLDNAALPHLTALRDRTDESAQLWVRRGEQRVCRLSISAEHELRITLPVGARVDLPAGSSGRILADAPGIREELAAQGWVESIGTRTAGVASVSAPVRLEGRVLGTVCLAMPIPRLTVSPGVDYGESVLEAARSIELDLR
ncbi:IclR family transcriptional regulator [Gulosibacter sp. 10]|uniref:IclR family transcriptional regulator n=1 Tax=Gulosibacter sp. 10 TaxID=1255570 RepID=UPI00097EBB5D|nr:helix-turn-helix domain-containing protein [Gulosibacter sp. 10]SJM66877.1 Transcriptional regulator, IclR family [Gulosibacter sp. 10]